MRCCKCLSLMVAVLVYISLAAGCHSMPPRLEGYEKAAATEAGSDDWPAPADARVTLQPGDKVQFQFMNHPELADEQTIRPDGRVSLQLVGEQEAAGYAPEELKGRLLAAYTDKVKNPEINVVVRSLDSRRIYVGGEVRLPQFLPLVTQVTPLQAIIQAGGFLKDTAQLRNVIIIRHRDGKRHARTIDLRNALYAARSEPLFLEPNDVVFVPRTRIDRVDQWVDQYINKIIPRNVHYTFTDSNVDTETRSETFQFVLPR